MMIVIKVGNGEVEKVMKVNNILRILQYKNMRSNSISLYTECGTLPMGLLHVLELLCFAHTYVYHTFKLSKAFSKY
jgi:hypothetical protein